MVPGKSLPERYRDRMLRPAGAELPPVVVTIRPATPDESDGTEHVPVKPPFYLTRSGDS